MKTKNPLVSLMTVIVFIIAVIKKTFSLEERFETLTEIESVMGSITGIAFLILLTISVPVSLIFEIHMLYVVFGLLLVLPWFYHVGRIMYVEKKALF